MTTEVEVLNHYESVADASEAMLAAARQSDWDALVEAEKECARCIARLKAARADAPLGPTGDKRRFDILRTVLAHDAEIRKLTQPWLAQLESFLTATAADRRVSDAYR
ncbi:MAG TPA: flagellar protein FliT [Burkholderiales bacterium]|nr:flagellar protein FliT [Burkholderiales bacterium]